MPKVDASAWKDKSRTLASAAKPEASHHSCPCEDLELYPVARSELISNVGDEVRGVIAVPIKMGITIEHVVATSS